MISAKNLRYICGSDKLAVDGEFYRETKRSSTADALESTQSLAETPHKAITFASHATC